MDEKSLVFVKKLDVRLNANKYLSNVVVKNSSTWQVH